MIILESKGLKINNETVDFTITQPTSPITKNTKTGDTLDLAKNPNAIIECELNNALIVTSTYPASFEYDGTVYSFNAKVTNQVYTAKGAYNVKLQVVGKVTAEDAPEPEPEKSEAPTITYDDTTFTVSASGDGEVKMYVDGTQVSSPHTFTQGETDVTYVVTATAQQDGKAISDTVTENCLVPAPAVTHTLEFYNVNREIPASSFSCSFNDGSSSDSDTFAVRYDGTAIDLDEAIYEASFEGNDNCMIEPIFNDDTGIADSAQFRADADAGEGTFTNTVVVTYEGITATCTVNVQVSMPEEPEE